MFPFFTYAHWLFQLKPPTNSSSCDDGMWIGLERVWRTAGSGLRLRSCHGSVESGLRWCPPGHLPSCGRSWKEHFGLRGRGFCMV